MSFTRFHDDPVRIKKENIETSAMNDYIPPLTHTDNEEDCDACAI